MISESLSSKANISQLASKDDESIIYTKTVALGLASGIFALESFINLRQARLQDRYWQKTSKESWNNGALQGPKDIRCARSKVHLRAMTASHFFLLVWFFIEMDVAPWLWAFVGELQAGFPPCFANEFWRSFLFLISCLVLYLAFNGPNLIFRSMVLKQDVGAELAAQWKSTWRLHELAGDNGVPTVLLFMAASVLAYQAIEIPFNRSYVLVFAAFQLTFGLLYPIIIQPKKKYLTLLGGTLKGEIHDLAENAKMKLQNVYISTGPLPKDIEDGIRTFGWPLQRHLSIHESVIRECTTEDIKALIAQQFGCWTHANGIRAFIFSNVRSLHSSVMVFPMLTFAGRLSSVTPSRW
jgi:CAAX prenyl protease N-terminal, five membrane helices